MIFSNDDTDVWRPTNLIYHTLVAKILFKAERGACKVVWCFPFSFMAETLRGQRSTCKVFKSCFNHKRLPPQRLLIPQALLKATSEEMVGSFTATSRHPEDSTTLTHYLSLSKGFCIFTPKMSLATLFFMYLLQRLSYLAQVAVIVISTDIFICLFGSIIQLVVIRHSDLLWLYYLKWDTAKHDYGSRAVSPVHLPKLTFLYQLFNSRSPYIIFQRSIALLAASDIETCKYSMAFHRTRSLSPPLSPSVREGKSRRMEKGQISSLPPLSLTHHLSDTSWLAISKCGPLFGRVIKACVLWQLELRNHRSIVYILWHKSNLQNKCPV